MNGPLGIRMMQNNKELVQILSKSDNVHDMTCVSKINILIFFANLHKIKTAVTHWIFWTLLTLEVGNKLSGGGQC